MPVNWTAIGLELAGQTVPLIQQFIQSSINGTAEEKKMKIMKRKVSQMQAVIKSTDSPGRTSTPRLTTGIKENESVEALGRRKWREFENVIADLPENASPSLINETLNAINSNIVNDFPCEECRQNAIINLKKSPLITPESQTKKDAQLKLCKFHNTVREMLGKPITHNCEVIFG